MNEFIKAILLGIVQGLTEFVPVSSTGHLIITGNLLEFSGEFAKTFDIAIQLGSILAVIIVYRDNFKEYIKPRPNLNTFPNIIHITMTTLPVLLIGFLLHGVIKKYLFSPFTVAIGLLLGSVLMIFADYYHRRTKHNLNIGYKKAISVGLFQCLALWPGMSRSGSTISGGIFCGMDHKKAASYSFICAVPAMFAATGYELLKTSHQFTAHEVVIMLIGFIVSFLVGWASILFLLKLVAKIKLTPFAVYRIILGIIILMVL
ncbi:MAG: undecaprenyl-diphosphate phosphatase [bacterium]